MNNNPSIDPANNNTLAGTLQFVFGKLMQQTDGMLPARVISYDRTTNRVQVQLMINLITTDGSQVPRPQIASLPVLLLGGGDFFISFPIKTGNMGWVLANDRDVSLFLQSYAQSPPNTHRVKSFSDGMFIPDVMNGFTIDPTDEDNLVIQSIDGLTKITIGASGINLESDIAITIKSDTISIDMSNPLNVLQLNGSLNATGTITP